MREVDFMQIDERIRKFADLESGSIQSASVGAQVRFLHGVNHLIPAGLPTECKDMMRDNKLYSLINACVILGKFDKPEENDITNYFLPFQGDSFLKLLTTKVEQYGAISADISRQL